MRQVIVGFAALSAAVLFSDVAPLGPAVDVVAWAAVSPDDVAETFSRSIRTATVTEPDFTAVDEMLLGSKGRRERWTHAPDLVVLTSVMQFDAGASSEYLATSASLTDEDADGLIRDLTAALGLLTASRFEQFRAVYRQAVIPGTAVRVLRSDQIVVARYRDVRHQVGTLGLGGRATRGDGSILSAAIILDDDYDRTGGKRLLLRTHELGHALGYNHVQSRLSVMNPRIGPEPTEFDRQVARIAFTPPEPATPDNDRARN